MVISSEVGKLLKASKMSEEPRTVPDSRPPPNADVIFDYTASGVRRSLEDSLQRLGIDSLDIAFVHDISSDNKLLPTSWQQQFEIAVKGAFPELTMRMRGRGIDQRLGNLVRPIRPNRFCRVLKEADPDCLSNGIAVFLNRSQECTQPKLFPAVRNKNCLSGCWFLH